MEKSETCPGVAQQGPSKAMDGMERARARCWQFLLTGWNWVQKPVDWVYNSMMDAMDYFSSFRCSEDKESDGNECTCPLNKPSSEVDGGGGGLQSFLADWQTVTGERSPLSSAGKRARRCCRWLRRLWDGLRRWCDEWLRDCWSRLPCPRAEKMEPGWAGGGQGCQQLLATCCGRPLARCWRAVTGAGRVAGVARGGGARCGRCLASCRRGLCLGLSVRGRLVRSRSSLAGGCSSMNRCCHSLVRGWDKLGRGCRSIARCLGYLRPSPRPRRRVKR